MVGQIRMSAQDVVTGLGQVAETLTLVGDALSAEQQQALVFGQMVFPACLCAVGR